MLVFVLKLLIKIEIRSGKVGAQIDIEDEDWAASEDEHRHIAVLGMTALSVGILINGFIILILGIYIDALTFDILHIEKWCKIFLPLGCVLVSSILWMFCQQTTETRELASFLAGMFLVMLTMFHVVALRLVSC